MRDTVLRRAVPRSTVAQRVEVAITRRFAAWSISTAVVLLVTTVAVSLASRQDRSFEVSNDPDMRVLQVESSGGLRMESTRYELFGDGRLVGLTISGYESGTPQLVFIEQLPLDEFAALVGDLVGSGLMEYDEKAIDARIAGALLPTDQTSIQVTLRLTRYEGREVNADGVVEHSFFLHAPRVRAQQFPEIRELAAIGRLIQRIAEIHRGHLVRVR